MFPKENPSVSTALVFPNTTQRDQSLAVTPTTKLGKHRDYVVHNYARSAWSGSGEREVISGTFCLAAAWAECGNMSGPWFSA